MDSEDLTGVWADALNIRKAENAVRLKGEESTFEVEEVEAPNPVPANKAPVIPVIPVIPEVPSASEQA